MKSRSNPSRCLTLWALASSSFPLACTPESEEWIGDYVTYSASPGLEVCRGTYEHVDEFIPFMAAELGIPAPFNLHYQWLDEGAFANSPCEPGSWGCAGKGRATSVNPAHLHEVAHLVASHSDMDHWPFFTEGIAVAFDPLGNDLGLRYVITPTPGDPLPDPRMFMTADSSEFVYGLAGSFASFLLSRHGSEKFVTLW